jgi:hypothetical protein
LLVFVVKKTIQVVQDSLLLSLPFKNFALTKPNLSKIKQKPKANLVLDVLIAHHPVLAYGMGWAWTPLCFSRACHALPFYALWAGHP